VFESQGDSDTVVPSELSDVLKKLVPKTDLKIIEKGGHDCIHEFESQFLAIIDQFLE